MGKWICGKCESGSTYYQGGALACMKCGNRTPSRWGFRSNDGSKTIKPIVVSVIRPPESSDTEEGEDMPSKRGICAGCGKERALVAADKCWKCNGYGGGGKSTVEKKKPASVPAEMSPDKVKIVKTEIRSRLADKFPDPLPIAMIDRGSAQLLSPDPRIVLLDFTLSENAHLYEPWLKYGRSHRRSAGDQAMMAVEQILTNEGLI